MSQMFHVTRSSTRRALHLRHSWLLPDGSRHRLRDRPGGHRGAPIAHPKSESARADLADQNQQEGDEILHGEESESVPECGRSARYSITSSPRARIGYSCGLAYL